MQKIAGTDKPQIGQPGFIPEATFIPEYVGTEITMGRESGNTHDIARFVTKDKAEVKIIAGSKVGMKPGTHMKEYSEVKVSIDPNYSCSSGPLESINEQ